MSRLPSFFTVSSGNAQLLQNVLIPRACNSSYNNQQFWNARTDLSNIGTLYATTVIASNFSGGTAGINTDQTKGTTYLGEGSDIGTYTTESNIAAYGTTVLGGNGQSTFAHGSVSNVVAVGAGALNLGLNIQKSVLIGTDAGYTASNVGSTVAIGDRVLFVGSGSNNVYLGTSNGYSNLGSGNVFLGSMVGTAETAKDNTLYIGNQLGVLLRGNFASQKLGLNCDPASNFDVSGDTRLRGNVVIDGDLTVSGGPIGSDVCTGQVVLGIGASSSNYPSLIAVRGGIQLSDGFIQLNRTDARDPVYRLDVSASARITGGSLIGGVTLSGTNVSTSGNVSISGNFSNIATSTNTIGGLTISNGNLVTSGTISGVFSNGSTSTNTIGGITISNGNLVTSGTISGVFSNASNTSNSIGGITISNGNLVTSGTISGVFSNASNTSNTIGGSLTVVGSNTSISGVILIGSSTSNAGAIAVRNSVGSQTIALNGGADGSSGYFYVANSNTTPTCAIFGSTGRISNSPTSSNSIGGITISNSYVTNVSGLNVNLEGIETNKRVVLGIDSGNAGFITVHEPTSSLVTFSVSGSTGRISNLPTSSNSIGGVTLGSLTGSDKIRMCNSGLCNSAQVNYYGTTTSATVIIYGKADATDGGGMLQFRNSADQITCELAGSQNSGASTLRLCNSNSSVKTIELLGQSGNIAITGTLSAGTALYSAGSSVPIMRYMVVGVAYDNDPQGNDTPRGNFTWTGTTDYATDVFMQTPNTCDKLSVYPRTTIEIYSTTNATGSCNVYSNTDYRSNVLCNSVGIAYVGSWKAYFI